VLRNWITHYWYDFGEDESLVNDFHVFIRDTMRNTMASAADALERSVEKKIEGVALSKLRVFNTQPPKPIPPQSGGGGVLSLMDIHPIELARQLTIIEYDLWAKIKPWEYLGKNWSRDDKEEKAPHIVSMIKRFNDVC